MTKLELDADTVSKLVINATMALNYKPPILPDVVTRLLQLAKNDEASFDEIESVIQSDAAVAGKVVSIANSVYFSHGIEIESLRTAISRLGLLQIRELAMHAAVTSRIFQVSEYQQMMKQERQHALGTATVCRKIGEKLKLQPEMSFLCGLLHDMGRPISIGIIVDLLRANDQKLLQPEELELLLADIHTRVGARIAALWNLPLQIVKAIELHHHPEQSQPPNLLAHIVFAADRLCHHTGVGRKLRPLSAEEQNPLDPFEKLALSQPQVQELIALASELAQSL